MDKPLVRLIWKKEKRHKLLEIKEGTKLQIRDLKLINTVYKVTPINLKWNKFNEMKNFLIK